jgi:prevent-host-death family protein
MHWTVHLAKEKFSELIRMTAEGPQVITRYGEEVAVLVSAEAYRKLSGKDFKTFLMEGPAFDDLEIERSREPARTVKW